MAIGSVLATAGTALSQQDADHLRTAAISVAVYECASVSPSWTSESLTIFSRYEDTSLPYQPSIGSTLHSRGGSGRVWPVCSLSSYGASDSSLAITLCLMPAVHSVTRVFSFSSSPTSDTLRRLARRPVIVTTLSPRYARVRCHVTFVDCSCVDIWFLFRCQSSRSLYARSSSLCGHLLSLGSLVPLPSSSGSCSWSAPSAKVSPQSTLGCQITAQATAPLATRPISQVRFSSSSWDIQTLIPRVLQSRGCFTSSACRSTSLP